MRNSINFYLVLAFISSILFMALIYILPSGIWEGSTPATCVLTKCFCEAIADNSPVKQPVNSWSSLAFVIAAFYMLGNYSITNNNQIQLTVWYARGISIASLITGFGSSIYHASLTIWGQFVDILGMFLLATIMLMYAWKRLYKINLKSSIFIFTLMNLVLTMIQMAIPNTRRYVFAVVFILALIFEYIYLYYKKPKILYKKAYMGLGLMTIAFGIWIVDSLGILCEPESVLQGHAIWHILGAVAVCFLYQYYSSEKAEL